MALDFPTGATNVVANERIWNTNRWDRLSSSRPPTNDNIEYIRINGAWRPKTVSISGSAASTGLYNPGLKFTTPPGARLARFYGYLKPNAVIMLQLRSSAFTGAACQMVGWSHAEGTQGYVNIAPFLNTSFNFFTSTFFTTTSNSGILFQGEFSVQRPSVTGRFSGWVQTFTKAHQSTILYNVTHLRLDTVPAQIVGNVLALPDIIFTCNDPTSLLISATFTVEWIY